MSDVRPVELVLPPSAQSSLPHLPPFVEHGGEIACRHPADAINSRLYGFVVDADRDLLDAYCDRCFNRPSGGTQHWEAVAGQVMINFVDIPTMGSTDRLDQRLGVCHEREAAIWVPIVDRVQCRQAWAVPYMFVDSALALVGGREVYGFPKQLGTLQIPAGDEAPCELSVDSATLRTYQPNSVVANHRVITARREGPPTPLEQKWGDPAGALRGTMGAAGVTSLPAIGGDGARGRVQRWLGRLFPVLDVLPEVLLFVQIVEEDIPMLLLKQFRDAHEEGAACYQAVVWVDMVVSLFRRGGFLPKDYQISIEPLAGEPISRELGIASSCTPRAAFWLEFDFVVELGHILWESAGARG